MPTRCTGPRHGSVEQGHSASLERLVGVHSAEKPCDGSDSAVQSVVPPPSVRRWTTQTKPLRRPDPDLKAAIAPSVATSQDVSRARMYTNLTAVSVTTGHEDPTLPSFPLGTVAVLVDDVEPESPPE